MSFINLYKSVLLNTRYSAVICTFKRNIHTNRLKVFHTKRVFENAKIRWKNYNKLNRNYILPFSSLAIATAIFKKEDEDTKEKQMKEDVSFEEEQIILYVKRARLAQMKGEFDEADKYYHTALKVLGDYEKKNLWESIRILQARVHVYSCMANLAMAQGKLNEAETLFKETMRGYLQQGKSKDDNAIIEMSLKLSMIYASQGEYSQAEQGYKHIIETQQKKVDDTREDSVDLDSVALLGMCLNSYSRYLMLMKRLPEAQSVMEKAVLIAEKSLGDEHPQVAVLMNDVANIKSMQGYDDEAITNLQKVIEISQAAEAPELAAYYCNMGELYFKKRNLGEAKTYCGKALKLASKQGDAETKQAARNCLDGINKFRKEAK